MPTSEKRIIANRANALHSTGPKSPTGRRTSARNAIKHGFLAKAILIEGESRELFHNLVKAAYAEFSPNKPDECTLVEDIAVARWRRLRLWTIESVGLNYEIRRQADSTADEDPATRAMLAMRSLADNSRHSELVSRFEDRFDRQHHRAIRELARLREQKTEKKAFSPNEASQLSENKEPAPSPESHEKPTRPNINP